MLISKSWLQDFVELPKKLTNKELAEKITLASVEVESVVDQAKALPGVIVAEILEVSKHPNADKLQLAKVNDGKGILNIVCGAPNIAKGQKVLLATVGTYLPVMEMTIVERDVRGQKSQGMLCASDELGIGSDHSGIVILPPEAKLGEPASKYILGDDVILEIDNKSMSHRPDMWCHRGIAREISAILGVKFKDLKIKRINAEHAESLNVKVEDKKACPRYMAVKLDGIEVGESPDWLKKRLQAVGQRSINNIVDVTNYVMFELGQSLHAFDTEKIDTENTEKTIIVRKAKNNEKVIGLDEIERTLTTDDLVIADKTRVLAIAGIKGALNSGVSASTSAIILESANFDHITIRKTSQRLNLRSEASARYEKSLDPNLSPLCLARAVELILQCCPNAKVVSKVIDISNYKLNQGPIKTTIEFIQKRIGQDIPAKEIVKILDSLGFKLNVKGKMLNVVVPTWRATKDVSIPEDLVEEVLRIYGYDKIKSQLPTIAMKRHPVDEQKKIIEKVRDILAYGFDMVETYNYSFIDEKLITQLDDDPKKYVKLINPIAKGLDVVRRSLVPGLLKSVESNSRFYEAFNIFEVGQIAIKEERGENSDGLGKKLLPKQDILVAGVVYEKGHKEPFYIAKNILEILAHRLRVSAQLRIATSAVKYLEPSRYLELKVGNELIGYVGELEKSYAKKLDIKERVGIFELNLSAIARMENGLEAYSPIPKFPSIDLDISMIVSSNALWKDIVDLIHQSNNLLIRSVELFDVYAGQGVPEGKKSVAFRISYRSDDKTLETSEAIAIHNQVKNILKEKLQATIRE